MSTLFHKKHNNLFTLPSKGGNMTRAQIKAMRSLGNNKSITIKPADKGGAVVIMDTNLYIEEAERQLSNTKYYIKISQPVTPTIIPTVQSILNQLCTQRFITPKQLRFLSPIPSNTNRKFHLLPKIHKPRENWPHSFMPPGRPIISDCNSPTYNISKFLDFFLRPLASQHTSYLKDTYDFVSRVQNRRVPPHTLLVTGDVTSLYTNMHHYRIIDSIKRKFSQNPDPTRPDKYILRLLILLLKNNDFQFNNQLYLQKVGAGMGYPMSPSCADIYLEDLDTRILQKYVAFLPYYFRFLDDITFAWTGTENQLSDFNTYVNSLIPDINITLTVKHYCVAFLDTILYKTIDNQHHTILQTKVHFKETDTHQLLHSTSCHPKHTFNSILKAQLIRFKRISSSFQYYNQSANILWKSLRTRGYSSSKFRKLKRDTYNNYRPIKRTQDNTQIFPIITYYDPLSSKLNRYIRKQIQNNPVFSNTKIISSYKVHRSLGLQLTPNPNPPTKIPHNSTPTPTQP